MTGAKAPGATDSVTVAIDAEFDKMSLKPGDVVTVRVGTKMDPDELRAVMNELRRMLPRTVSVLVFPADIDIRALEADEMARLGWVRAH